VVSIPQEVKKRVKEADMEYFRKSHAWITTYAPSKKPEYVVTVLVEHGGHGGSASGPIAADIYQWMFANGYFRDYTQEKPVSLTAEQKVEQRKQELQFFDRLRREQLTPPPQTSLSVDL